MAGAPSSVAASVTGWRRSGPLLDERALRLAVPGRDAPAAGRLRLAPGRGAAGGHPRRRRPAHGRGARAGRAAATGRRAHGALGRSRGAGLQRRRPGRRDARPQRAAAAVGVASRRPGWWPRPPRAAPSPSTPRRPSSDDAWARARSWSWTWSDRSSATTARRARTRPGPRSAPRAGARWPRRPMPRPARVPARRGARDAHLAGGPLDRRPGCRARCGWTSRPWPSRRTSRCGAWATTRRCRAPRTSTDRSPTTCARASPR